MEYLSIGQKINPSTEPLACEMWNASSGQMEVAAGDSVYGYAISGAVGIDQQPVAQSQYFSWTSQTNRPLTVTVEDRAWLIVRRGFRAQNIIGSDVESRGRLVYIDGCSDSLLIYPPRQGDPSLNLLVFPPCIDQTFHIHPSLRMGLVIDGEGMAEQDSGGTVTATALTPGTVFYLPTLERHRFRTTASSMRVLAFHADGDWGPTDHNHTMLNRTYLK
jgi:quercetin dioxygenase-like cupin family protein